jgi:predicted ATPase/DNA-binding CsgD family transcriptional regulator
MRHEAVGHLAENWTFHDPDPGRESDVDGATPPTLREVRKVEDRALAASVPLQRMFGRDEDLRKVLIMLESSPALVSITGPAGVGKTRLAAETVRAMSDVILPEASLPDGTSGGATWIRLAGVTSPELVVTAIAAGCGVPVRPGVDPVDAVAGVLDHGSRLLVLDNADPVLGGTPLIRTLLARCPNLRVLVTSEMPLGLRPEQVLPLSALPVPDEDEGEVKADGLEALARQPSVATYCQRAHSVDRSFELTDANAPAVVDVCRRLHGLPLALELAGARAAMLPAVEQARRLGGADGCNGLDDGMRSAVGWTYELLDRGAQAALRRLSVLAGSFDVDAAAEVIGSGSEVDLSDGTPFDHLSSLVDLHLVDPVPGSRPARFVMARCVRSFAAEELDRLGETEKAELSRIRLRARQARTLVEGDGYRGVEGRAPEIEGDRDDAHGALEAALEHELADEAMDLVCGLGPLWDVRGFGPYQQELVERSLVLAERTPGDPLRVAGVLLWSALLGLRHWTSIPRSTLIERIERADELADIAGDDATRYRAQWVWLLVAPFTGDLDRARAAAHEGYAVAERLGNEAWCAAMQLWSAVLVGADGDEARVVELGTAAFETARRAGDLETVLRAVLLLGPLADRHPELTQILPTTQESISLARQLGLPFSESLLLVRIAGECTGRGEFDLALRRAAEALVVARTMPDSPAVAFGLMAMAKVASARGDADRAGSFRGAVRRGAAAVDSLLSDPQLQSYRAAFDAEASDDGVDAGADSEAEADSELSWSRAVDEAIAYADEAGDAAVVQLGVSTVSVADAPEQLTARDEQVLRLIAAGLSNKEIAATLRLGSATVMHHATAVYRILGVRGRSEATALAYRSGLVD